MENKIDFENCNKKLIEIENLTNQMKDSLKNINQIIEENINTGKGIWDGESASFYRQKWDTIKEEIPSTLDTFQKQENNLKNMLEIMKKSEEE